MAFYYNCSSKSFKKINRIKLKVTNRYNLRQKIGEEINGQFKHCGSFTKRYFNRLQAGTNYKIIFGGILFVAFVVLIFWDFGYSLTLSTTIPIEIWAYEVKKVSQFNKYLI
jgi:hypothetical protein